MRSASEEKSMNPSAWEIPSSSDSSGLGCGEEEGRLAFAAAMEDAILA